MASGERILIEILVPKQAYRVQIAAKYAVRFRPLHTTVNLMLSLITSLKFHRYYRYFGIDSDTFLIGACQ